MRVYEFLFSYIFKWHYLYHIHTLLTPPIFIQNVYFNTKTYTIYLWILALFFYDTHHELEIIYFFFPNTKSPKRKYTYDTSELLCPAPITYTIIKTTKEFADDTATSSLMISSR